MAEYIKLSNLRKFCKHYTEYDAVHLILENQTGLLPTADVVERSKIDKAIAETYKIRQEVLHNDNGCYEPNDILDIIDEISKLFEEL